LQKKIKPKLEHEEQGRRRKKKKKKEKKRDKLSGTKPRKRALKEMKNTRI
jgi:hypothetical protein